MEVMRESEFIQVLQGGWFGKIKLYFNNLRVSGGQKRILDFDHLLPEGRKSSDQEEWGYQGVA